MMKSVADTERKRLFLVGRILVVPRSDPGGVYSVYVRGLRFIDKEADERANLYVGFLLR